MPMSSDTGTVKNFLNEKIRDADLYSVHVFMFK